MAKDKKSKGENEGGKITLVLIVVLIVTTWLSVMALLIKCDVGGFGSEVLRPVFKNVPIIKEILPPASDEEVAKESDYPYNTLESALAKITELEASNASKDAEIKGLNDKNDEMSSEIERLKTFEDEQKSFEEEKNKFYDEIVYGETAPSTDTYIEWYNSIDKEYAEEIYREIIEKGEADKEIRDLAISYESMSPEAAAKILQAMDNDMDMVALIMNNMDTKAQGLILEAMDPEFAASVTKKLLP